MTQALVSLTDGVPTTTSLIVARELDIVHHDFFNNILLKHRPIIEENFGILCFDNTKLTEGRGRPTKYAVLNEGQALTLLAFSQNTDRAVAAKVGFVREFQRMKAYIQGQQQEIPAQSISSNEPIIHVHIEHFHYHEARPIQTHVTSKVAPKAERTLRERILADLKRKDIPLVAYQLAQDTNMPTAQVREELAALIEEGLVAVTESEKRRGSGTVTLYSLVR